MVLQTACQVLPSLAPLSAASLFHCSASLLSANVVHRGSSVNYSTSQEGRGTWWWGLGAGSHTIKPGNRPPSLFSTTIPAPSRWFLPVLCVSCPQSGSKCCCRASDIHERPGCSSSFVLPTMAGRRPS